MLHKNRTMMYFYFEEKYFSRYSSFNFDRTRPDKRNSLYHFWKILRRDINLANWRRNKQRLLNVFNTGPLLMMHPIKKIECIPG